LLTKLFSHELPGYEFLVNTIKCDEFIMTTLFSDFTLAEHNDLVSVPDSWKSV